jgi:hypothetical protein
MDAPQEMRILSPHVEQVARARRIRAVIRRKGDGKKRRRARTTARQTAYVITSLSASAAGQHVASCIRSHRG